MKVIFLVLALAAVVLAGPADDAKSDGKNRGEGHFDGNLKFDLFGDSNLKGRFEALVKPITDFLKGFGLNGEVKSEGDGKSGGHLIGEFKFGGRRASKANAALPGSNSETSSAQASVQIPSEILSLFPSGIQQNQKAAKTVRV